MNSLSARQAAAIMLKVPRSGDDWLDAMIGEASRRQLQGYAMAALMVHNTMIEHARMLTRESGGSPWSEADVAAFAKIQADAVMAGQLPLDF